MNSQLQKSSIRSLLQSKGKEYAAGRVKTESMQTEMTLMGFVPYPIGSTNENSDLYKQLLDIDLNSHLIVTPFFIRYEGLSKIYPVFKIISLSNGCKYKLDKNLIVETIRRELPHYIVEKITGFLDGNAIKNIKGYKSFPSNLIEMDENKELYYTPNDNDYVLSESLGELVCVSDYFLCLCMFINSVTGAPSYAVFPPEDIVRVIPKNE
jgi:hypothetical protein